MALVLIVDDASFMRMRLRRVVTEAGHDVIEAARLRPSKCGHEHKPDAC